MNKPRLLIMNRADMVSQQDQQDWSNYYGRQGLSVYYTDANAGKGITKVMLCAVDCVMIEFVAKEANPSASNLPTAVLWHMSYLMSLIVLKQYVNPSDWLQKDVLIVNTACSR